MPPPQPVRPPSPAKSLGNLHPGMLASSLSQGVGDRFGERQELCILLEMGKLRLREGRRLTQINTASLEKGQDPSPWPPHPEI